MNTEIPQDAAPHLGEIDQQAHDWVVLFADGRATPADLEAFKAWSVDPSCKEAFALACRIWEDVAPAGELSRRLPRSPSRISRRAVMGGGLAASLALGAYAAMRPPLDLWPSVPELAADVRTAPGERRSIALAGGPSVELNTRTSIALLPAGNDGSDRIRLISGEAAIAARSDSGRAINVVAAGGEVITGGGEFNIRCDRDRVSVTCISGALQVGYRGQSIQLRANQRVAYSGSGLTSVATADPAIATAWKDGTLVFESTPLAEAVAEINRYRSGPIILTNAALGRRIFNARLHIANMEGIISQIQQIFGASAVSLPGGVVLLS